MRKIVVMSLLIGALAAGAPSAVQAAVSPAPHGSRVAAAKLLGPAPPEGRIRLRIEGASGSTSTVAQPGVVSGDSFRVRGLIRPYIPGQKVDVYFKHAATVLGHATATVRASRGGSSGYFLFKRSLRIQGRLTVVAVSRATPEQIALFTVMPLVVLPSYLPHGATGPSVWTLQRMLARRGYALNLDGRLDDTTVRAVVAFRKETELGRSETVDAKVFRALLDGRGAFPVRYPGHGKHVEADLFHQVLAEIEPGGHVRRIYPTSSGKPSTPTVIGNFAVYTKDFGTNQKGMVDSNYFIGGYAIHGYAEVPLYAASHGCLRIPIPDAKAVYDWLSIGDRVDVYERGSGGSRRINSNAGP